MSNPSDSSTGRAPSQSRPFARAEVALDALARIQALDEDAMERYRLAGNAFYAREQRAAAAAAAAGYREVRMLIFKSMSMLTQARPDDGRASALNPYDLDDPVHNLRA